MIKILSSNNMGKSELGWLHSIFHFSFANYYNEDNMQFGVLRVVNDDIVEPQTGFDTHPHKNMEIVSYVVNGTLTHQDSMGNKRALTRGQVQYMSAGTGVQHSEYNLGEAPLRFLQIWILPDKDGYAPNYGDFEFDWEARENKWLKIVSGQQGNADIIIHQDAEISVLSLGAGKQQGYSLKPGRMAYLIQIEGNGTVNDIILDEKSSAEIINETEIVLSANTKSHFILFDITNAQ